MTPQELDEAAAELERLGTDGESLRTRIREQITLYGYKSYHLRGKLYDFFHRNGKLVVERHEPEPQSESF